MGNTQLIDKEIHSNDLNHVFARNKRDDSLSILTKDKDRLSLTPLSAESDYKSLSLKGLIPIKVSDSMLKNFTTNFQRAYDTSKGNLEKISANLELFSQKINLKIPPKLENLKPLALGEGSHKENAKIDQAQSQVKLSDNTSKIKEATKLPEGQKVLNVSSRPYMDVVSEADHSKGDLSKRTRIFISDNSDNKSIKSELKGANEFFKSLTNDDKIKRSADDIKIVGAGNYESKDQFLKSLEKLQDSVKIGAKLDFQSMRNVDVMAKNIVNDKSLGQGNKNLSQEGENTKKISNSPSQTSNEPQEKKLSKRNLKSEESFKHQANSNNSDIGKSVKDTLNSNVGTLNGDKSTVNNLKAGEPIKLAITKTPVEEKQSNSEKMDTTKKNVQSSEESKGQINGSSRDKSQPNTIFREKDVPWKLLKPFGVTKEGLEQKGKLNDFLNGEKTPLITKSSINIGGIAVSNFSGKFNLVKNEEGKLEPRITLSKSQLDIPNQKYGHNFSEEDKNKLSSEGHLGRKVTLTSKSGKEYGAYFSVDKETNTVEMMPAWKIRIPDKIKGVDLDQQQRKDLAEGKRVEVKGLQDKEGNKFNGSVQINAAKQTLEIKAAPGQAKELNQSQSNSNKEDLKQSAPQQAQSILQPRKEGKGKSI
jgi:hypothetical protein